MERTPSNASSAPDDKVKNMLTKHKDEEPGCSSTTGHANTVQDSEVSDKNPQASEKISPSSGRNSPDPCCAICLEQLQNKSFTNSCRHMFCFKCLVDWSKVKPECPLCKQQFQSIIHNVQKDSQYDTYHIRSRSTQRIWNVTQTHLGVSSSIRISTNSDSTPQRFRYRTTLTTDRISERNQASFQDTLQMQIENHRRRFAPHSVRISTTQTANRIPSQVRNRIYQQNLWVKTMNSTRIRVATPEFFKRHPATTHRLLPWLNRELIVLLQNIESQIVFVLELIMALITRYEISSHEFFSHIEPYLHQRTSHFIHEFYNFAISPFDMETYDSLAEYEQHSEVVSDDDSNSDIIILENEDTNVPENSKSKNENSQISRKKHKIASSNQVDKIILKRNSKADSWVSVGESLSPSFQLTSSLSNPGPSTSGLMSNPYSTSEQPYVLISPVRVESSDEDECEIVAVVKPRAERTPEIVDLSSDDETSNVIYVSSNDNVEDNDAHSDISADPSLNLSTHRPESPYSPISSPSYSPDLYSASDELENHIECVFDSTKSSNHKLKNLNPTTSSRKSFPIDLSQKNSSLTAVERIPVYEPVSPATEPLSLEFEPSSPIYEPVSPIYEPVSPATEPLSLEFEPQSPESGPLKKNASLTTMKRKKKKDSSFSSLQKIRKLENFLRKPSKTECSSFSPSFSPFLTLSPVYEPTSPISEPSSPAYERSSPSFSPGSPFPEKKVPTAPLPNRIDNLTYDPSAFSSSSANKPSITSPSFAYDTVSPAYSSYSTNVLADLTYGSTAPYNFISNPTYSLATLPQNIGSSTYIPISLPTSSSNYMNTPTCSSTSNPSSFSSNSFGSPTNNIVKEPLLLMNQIHSLIHGSSDNSNLSQIPVSSSYPANSSHSTTLSPLPMMNNNSGKSFKCCSLLSTKSTSEQSMSKDINSNIPFANVTPVDLSKLKKNSKSLIKGKNVKKSFSDSSNLNSPVDQNSNFYSSKSEVKKGREHSFNPSGIVSNDQNLKSSEKSCPINLSKRKHLSSESSSSSAHEERNDNYFWLKKRFFIAAENFVDSKFSSSQTLNADPKSSKFNDPSDAKISLTPKMKVKNESVNSVPPEKPSLPSKIVVPDSSRISVSQASSLIHDEPACLKRSVSNEIDNNLTDSYSDTETSTHIKKKLKLKSVVANFSFQNSSAKEKPKYRTTHKSHKSKKKKKKVSHKHKYHIYSDSSSS